MRDDESKAPVGCSDGCPVGPSPGGMGPGFCCCLDGLSPRAHRRATLAFGWYRNEVKRLTAERDAALRNYQWMVERAADERLDGYRDLGAKAAAAEAKRDEARAEVERLTRERDEARAEVFRLRAEVARLRAEGPQDWHHD